MFCSEKLTDPVVVKLYAWLMLSAFNMIENKYCTAIEHGIYARTLSTDGLFILYARLKINFPWRCDKSVHCSCCVVTVQGHHFQRGSRLVDFEIKIGESECDPVEPLTNNLVNCIPPKNKPKKNVNDTCPRDTLALHVSLCKLLESVCL